MQKNIQRWWIAYRGIAFMLLSSFCFASMSALAKYMNQSLPSIELVFFRSAVGLPFLLYSLYQEPPKNQKGGELGFLIYRGLIGAFTMYCLFYALEHLGLSLTNTYGQAFPLFIALMTFLWVPNERLSLRQALFLMLGFMGILFIFQPEANIPWTKHGIGIVYALGTALGYLAIKKAQRSYDSRWIIISFMGMGLLCSIVSLALGTYFHWPNGFFSAQWVNPTWFQWIQALILGLLALGVQGFTTKALKYEKTSVVGAIGNSSVLFSILIELTLGNPLPNALTFLGMGMVLMGSYQVSLRKNKEG